MPQVASAAAVSPSLRSDAPARAAATGQPAGAFVEMLDAASGTLDPAGNKPAQANPKESAAAQSTGEPAAGAIPLPGTTGAPTITVDLTLLAPGVAADASASSSDPAVAAKEDEDKTGNPDKAAVDPGKTDSDENPTAGIKPAEVSITLAPPVAAPPPPQAVPVQAQSGEAVADVASSGARPALVAQPKLAAVETATRIATTPTNLPPPSESDTPSTSAPSSSEGDAASAQPNAAAPHDTSAQPKLGGVVAASAKPVEQDQAPAASGHAVARPVAPAGERPETDRSEPKAAKVDKADAGKEQATPHLDAQPAQAHAAADAAHPAGQPGDQDEKPAHQPTHAQPSEHASATARVAVAAAQGDHTGPASVAQAVTAQLAGNPSPLGLSQAVPLAAPVQSLWQAAPRTDTNDNAVPIAGVAVEIVSRAQEGARRFEIRLDPPELGRIDVRLDVDRGGNVTSRLTVDRVETLDLLRRDAPQLERALQHAGLNTEGGLQFSLRDQSFANRNQPDTVTPTLIIPDEEPAAADAVRGYGRLMGLGSGVDIRV